MPPDDRAKRFTHFYSKLAWWLSPLAALVGLVILFFGTSGSSPGEPTVLGRPSPDTELLSLGTQSARLEDLYADFIPPNENLRQRVLENLRRFQTKFRQSAPAIHVAATPGSSNRDLALRGSELPGYVQRETMVIGALLIFTGLVIHQRLRLFLGKSNR